MVTQTVAEAVSQTAVTGTGVDPDIKKFEADRENRQWTIKGLDPSTIEVTREAAKRSGMKLNSFISQALSRAASEATELSDHNEEASADDMKLIKAELAKIREQGQQLESTVNSISAILLKICADRL